MLEKKLQRGNVSKRHQWFAPMFAAQLDLIRFIFLT